MSGKRLQVCTAWSPSLTTVPRLRRWVVEAAWPRRTALEVQFRHPEQRTQIANTILASQCAPSITGTCVGAPLTASLGTYAPTQTISGALSANDIALINAGTYRFTVARVLSDIGIRDELFKRDTYRGVVGVRGTFNTD